MRKFLKTISSSTVVILKDLGHTLVSNDIYEIDHVDQLRFSKSKDLIKAIDEGIVQIGSSESTWFSNSSDGIIYLKDALANLYYDSEGDLHEYEHGINLDLVTNIKSTTLMDQHWKMERELFNSLENPLHVSSRATISEAVSEARSIALTNSGSGGGVSDRVVDSINQNAHGFNICDPLYFDGTSWKLARADIDSTTTDAIVYSVEDVDNFTIIVNGWMIATTNEWDNVTGDTGGLVAGHNYVLSQSVFGKIESVIPTVGIIQYIIKSITTTEALVYVGEPYEIGNNSEATTISEAFSIGLSSESIADRAESIADRAESIADRAESIADLNNISVSPNLVIVDPDASEIVGEIYQTWSDADSYVQTQSPSSTNKWGIKITGTNSENIILRSYISILGEQNITRLTGSVNSSGNYGGDFFEYYISDCEITNFSLGSTYTTTISNCRITGTTITSTGYLIALKSNIDVGDYTSLTFFFGVHCILGPIDLPSGSDFILSQLGQASGSPDLNGGTFRNSIIENTGTYSSGSYYIYNCLVYTSGIIFNSGVDVEMYNCTGRGGTVTLNTGSSLLTANCVEFNVSENGGNWINRGAFYDNSGSHLTSTDIQGAIDELTADSEAISETKSIANRAESISLLSGSSNVVIETVNQNAHGFIPCEAVYNNGSIWLSSQANSDITTAEAIVYSVEDVDNFTVIISGWMTATTNEWDAVTGDTGGLVAGNNYVLSQTLAGEITITEPNTGTIQYLLKALSITEALIYIGDPFDYSSSIESEGLIASEQASEIKSIAFQVESVSDRAESLAMQVPESLAEIIDQVNDFNDSIAKSPVFQDYSEIETTVSSSSGTINLNLENSNIFLTTLTENITTVNIINAPSSNRSTSITWVITQDSTARTITWPSGIKWSGNYEPILTTVSTVYIIELFYAGSTWYGFLSGSDMQ